MRHALRTLRRTPVFTTVAVVTLALGIGASSALFSVADPLFTRPLPVRAPDELVLFRTLGSPGWSDVEALVPFALHEQLNQQSASFTGAFAFEADTRGTGSLRVRTPPGERLGPVVRTTLVSGAFFETLGVSPVLGRLIVPADDHPAAEPVAVISYAFWQERYGGDPAVVGASLALDPQLARPDPATVTIAGVARRGFHGVNLDVVPDMWLPAIPTRLALRRVQVDVGVGGIAHTMARLRPGVDLRQAQAEVDALAEHVFDNLPGLYADVAAARPRIRVEPAGAGYSVVRERFRDPVRILLTGVAFVLLMACANVAALLLARAASRQQEIAVRLSLGGGRLTIVKLVLTESLVLASAGGALAVLAVWWATRAAPVYLPVDVGVAAGIGIHLRVLAFTAALSLLSVLAFGLGPALWSTRQPVERLMREGSGGGRRPGSVARLHRLVIPLQVAFAVVLLAGAGLFVRTLEQLRVAETGFDDARLVEFGIEYEARMGGPRSSLDVPPALLDRLAGLPGVDSITVYDGPRLLHGDMSQAPADPDDQAEDGEDRRLTRLLVGPRFFETLGIPFVAGRALGDDEQGATLAVVSASLATHLFGRPDAALGQTIDTSFVRHEIVGVVEDVTPRSLRDARAWTVYLPRPPMPVLTSAVVLRTRDDPAQLAAAVRAAVQAFSPRFDVRDLRTFSQTRDASILRERALAHVSVAFGVLATLLAAIGIAGVVAYSVAQRTAEIGLRMALGAGVVQVVTAVVGRLMGLVAGGVALGLLGVALLAPLVASQLFGVAPFDPVAVGGAVLIVLVSGAVAACVPASRAARRIDPIIVLKGE